MSYRPGESFVTRWGRRLISCSLVTVAWFFTVVGLAVLPLVVLVDVVRRTRLAWARAQLALLCFLTVEVLGLAAAGCLWFLQPLVSRGRWLALNASLQRRWVRVLFGGLRRLYGMKLMVDDENALEASGPLVVLSRHTSLIDTLLPVLMLDGWRLRYVLKRELLWDPCLDVVGQRIPNAFVRRGSENSAAELGRVSALATGLGPGEAAVIFPEGTRYTPGKREQVLAHLARSGDTQALLHAQGLLHVLPPRRGGTRALLAACPQASVLLLSHAGLEGAQTLASLANGALIGRTLHVRLRLFPCARVPRDPESFEPWLMEAWGEMDRWVAERLPSPAELTAVAE